MTMIVGKSESAELCALAPMRLLPIIDRRLYPHHDLMPYAPLSCLVLLQLKGKVYFVCAFQLTIHARLSSLFHVTI